MRILLISIEMEAWAPGLRSISAVLKAAGHDTRLVYMTAKEKLFSINVLKEISLFARDTEIIGISCLAQGADKARQTIEYLRAQNKPIVWGGVHASLNPEECADFADIVCLGEGEGMMLDLVERLKEGRDWKDIENIAYKENGTLIVNDLRPPISDLDELPLPDFSFENEFHLAAKGFVQVSTLPGLKESGQIIFNSSRGCFYHCTYCCNNKLKNLYPRKEHYVRRMSVSRLIEHAQKLRNIFPQGKFFYFIDEDFTARPLEDLAQLAEEFPQKVGLPFACLAHPARITTQKMDSLVKAGLFRIHLGIESGSERVKKEIYDRHVSNEVVKRATDIISGYPQVVPIYFFIFANPYEEREDLLATIRLISSLPSGCLIQTYNLVFFPGSDLHIRAVQDGLIKGDGDSGYELHILDGYQYKGHSWKKKNLYMNALIFLMDGWSTSFSIGNLPRLAINALLRPGLMEFNEKHTFAIKGLISIKFLFMQVQKWAIKLLRKIIGNHSVAHNLGYYLRMNVFRRHLSGLT